ncbi:MAG: DNA polymerase beta superfamily protein [Thermoplasmataceae archaeon]
MPSSNEVLWVTNVGSHMWSMQRPGSDIDIFECYISPTRSILRGSRGSNHFTQEDGIDTQRHEIGQVTSQIIKSNINYIGYVFSPLILQGENFLKEYQKLAMKVLSKQVYNSVKGMALHNYKKYKNELGDKVDSGKWDKIIRVVRFGSHLMSTGQIEFLPAIYGNEDKFNAMMESLDYYKENGDLQDAPSQEDIDNLWNFVIDERIKRL